MKKKSLFLSATSAIVFVSIVCFSFLMASCIRSKSYKFDGYLFSSKDDALVYAEGKLKQEVEVLDGNEKLYSEFNTNDNQQDGTSFDTINKQLEDLITEKNVDVKDAQVLLKGEAQLSDLKENSSESKWVYRRENGTITEGNFADLRDGLFDACKKRKFSGYFFRNYFLQSTYHVKVLTEIAGGEKGEYVQILSKSANDKFVIKSQPIFLSYSEDGELKNEFIVKKIIKNFLNVSTNIVYAVENDNKIEYFENISDFIGKFCLNPEESFYIPKNNACSDYVIDIKDDKKHDYYGPYISNCEFGVKKIQDKNLWHVFAPESINDNNIINVQKENVLLGEFFNFLVPDISIDSDNLFNISYLKNASHNYKQFMLKNARSVYEKALLTARLLDRGQRRSILHKLPVMYSIISEEIAKNSLDTKCVVETNRYFFKILEFLNKVINAIFPNFIFQNLDKKAQRFNLTDMFHRVDENSNQFPSYYLDSTLVKKKYPHFIPAVKLSLLAIANRISLNGDFSYDSDFVRSVISFPESDEKSLMECFKKIWKIFSAKTFDIFVEQLLGQSNILSKDEIQLLFAEYALRINLLVSTLSEEYKLQSIKFKNNKEEKKSGFFQNVPNVLNLLNNSNGSYGNFFLSQQMPIDQVDSSPTTVSIPESKESGLSNVRKFFKAIKTSVETSRKIIPNIRSFLKFSKKFTQKFNFPSLTNFFGKIDNLFNQGKLITLNDICNAFSNVEHITTQLSNLISDVWLSYNESPVKKLTYQFLDSNSFIDNNAFFSSSNAASSKNCGEDYLKQLLEPIKISEPRSVSNIYFNKKLYIDDTNGVENMKYVALNNAISAGKHEVGNVRLYYSLNGTSELVKKLNTSHLDINSLLDDLTLYSSSKLLETRIFELCKKKNIDKLILEKNDTNKSKKTLLCHIDNYEKTLNSKWNSSLFSLPYSDENGYFSLFTPSDLNQNFFSNIFYSNNVNASNAKIVERDKDLTFNPYFVLLDYDLIGSDETKRKELKEIQSKYVKYMVNKMVAMKKVFKKRIYITPDNDESYKKEDFDSLVEKKTKTLFEVFNPLDRKTVFFDDRQDAKEYLLKQSNLKKTSKNKTVTRWVYDNRIAFDNLKKFQEWVNSKIVSV